MDAIIYLRKQHNKFRQTFKSISNLSSSKAKQTKFKALCKALVKHETAEQKAWYPVLRKNKKLQNVIKHLLSEEKSAAKAIKKFKKMKFGILWKLKFLKFKHDVLHHAKDEERKLFPKARKLLTKQELNKLGTKIRKVEAR